MKYKKLDPNATPPKKAKERDAGYDLSSLHHYSIPGIFEFEYNDFGESEYTFDWKDIVPQKIETGIAIEIPDGYVGMICDRSGLGSKGIKVHGGIIDVGYTGQIIVCLHNVSDKPLEIKPGDRIAQILIIPIASPELEEVQELSDSERGTTGFGASGV